MGFRRWLVRIQSPRHELEGAWRRRVATPLLALLFRSNLPPSAKLRGRSGSWPGRWRFQQGLRLGTEGFQLLLLFVGQLALVFLTPTDRAVVRVLGLGRFAEPLLAQGQNERVEPDPLAGCQL